MNYTRFLNAVSLARRPSPIRKLTNMLANAPPELISLAGGMPNPALFPFQTATVRLRDGTAIELDENKMKTALQYQSTQGIPPLVSFVKEMQKAYHSPPTLGKAPEDGGLAVNIVPGSQDGICKSMEMLLKAGDNMILDVPTYAGTLAILRPLGVNMLSVESDQHGMVTESLRQVLSPWKPSDAKDPNSTIPKVLYTIPNGVNPTGMSLTEERKKEIYQIAREYDLLILEDDPYYFLQFTKEKAPSFLSLDEDGRVIRFDSFSKIMSAGIRIGVATGPHPLIQHLQMHLSVSSLQPSSLSMVFANEVLQHWGLEGFKKHIEQVVDFYSSQKEAMMTAVNKHLKDLVEFHEPIAGMFFWMKIKGITDSKKLIEEKAFEKNVVMVPGCAFMADPDEPSPYVRAAFSIATPQQIDTAMERLATVIKEELASQGK